MTASTLTALPGAHAPGGAAKAENPLATPIQQAFHRAATTPDYFGWLDHVASAAGCSHPIRLAGCIDTLDAVTGDVIGTRITEDMPDGVIYKSCGNRRASVCLSCSTTYRRDAYQLIRAGLVGGKGVPATVTGHPAVFATFTAPGFGSVHTRRTSKAGQALQCRPRRDEDRCSHGVDLRCDRIHAADEKTLEPRCALTATTTSTRSCGITPPVSCGAAPASPSNAPFDAPPRTEGIDPATVRLSYGKVAEMQRRGVVHFHAIIRLDGVDPTNPDAVVPVSDGLGLGDLVDAVEHAARHTRFISDAHERLNVAWLIEWGEQLDIRPVRVPGDGIHRRDGRRLPPRQVRHQIHRGRRSPVPPAEP